MNIRKPSAVFAVAAASLLLAPVASADDNNGFASAPTGIQNEAVKAADSAATGPLGNAFSANVAKNANKGISANAATKREAAPVSVHMLSPQFVKDGTGPVGQFAYAATSYTVKGNDATVYSVKQGSSWQGVNIATGTTEQQMADKADGSTLLLEPQVHAYYAVKGDRVEALNDSAHKALGADSVSMDEYAKLVHDRYAQMLPGSAYDKKGAAGGFETSAKASSGSSEGSSNAAVTAAGLGGIAALGAGAVVYRRRRA